MIFAKRVSQNFSTDISWKLGLSTSSVFSQSSL